MFSQIEVKPLSMDPGYVDMVLIPVKLKKKKNEHHSQTHYSQIAKSQR